MFEKQSISQFEAEKPSKKHYIYIAGALGAKAGQRLTEEYIRSELLGPDDSVEAFGSIVSTDEYSATRLEEIVVDAKQRLSSGENLHFIAHSLGAVELARIIRMLKTGEKRIDPETLKRNVHIYLVAPFGLVSSTKEITTLLARVGEKEKPLYKGIGSLALFFPENITAEEMSEYLAACVSELPQAEASHMQSFLPQGRGFFDSFSQEDQDAVRTTAQLYDVALQHAGQARDWRSFRSILINRGKALQEYTDLGYSGHADFEHPDAKLNIKTLVGNIFKNLRTQEGRSLVTSFFSGEVYRTFLYLKAMGVRVDVLVPQLDTLLPYEEAQRVFLDWKDPEYYQPAARSTAVENEVAVVGNSSHESFALRPQALILAVKKLLTG